MGKQAKMASRTKGVCLAVLAVAVVVSAVHEEPVMPLTDAGAQMLGEARGASFGYFCTPKGNMSPNYAYNDKHCSVGKVQSCGEVWCCQQKGKAYSCTRGERVSMKKCKGTAPTCSGPKPTGRSAKAGKTGAACKDQHDSICRAANLFGHCKHADYAAQCPLSCGKCTKVSATTAKRIVAQVVAKKAIKKMKKTDSSVAKKTAKKAKKKARKSARKAARKESRRVAQKKKAKKALRKAIKKEKKAAKKATKKAKKKLKKVKKAAKKAVKKAQKKIKRAKQAKKAAKKAVRMDKAKVSKAKAKLAKKPRGKNAVAKAKLKVKLAKKKVGAAKKKEAKVARKLRKGVKTKGKRKKA